MRRVDRKASRRVGIWSCWLVFGSLAFLLVPTPSAAQEAAQVSDTITIPLTGPPEITLQVDASRRYVLVVEFALPLVTYSLSEVLSRNPTGELNFPVAVATSSCNVNQQALAVVQADTEELVRSTAQTLARGMEAPGNTCQPADIERARTVLAATKREWVLGPYDRGTEVTLTVSRAPVLTQTQPRAWQIKLSSPSRGSWTTSFGFGLLYQNWSRPDDYYIREVDGGREAVNAGPRQSLSFAPSLVFSYDDPGEGRGGFEWRKVAGGFGLGPVDLSNPFVFIGTGAAYRENIGLFFGVAAQGVQKIRPQYVGSGDTPAQVPSGVTEDQLYTNRIGINPYFMVSFRFGSNPFSSSDPPKPEAVEQQEAGGG